MSIFVILIIAAAFLIICIALLLILLIKKRFAEELLQIQHEYEEDKQAFLQQTIKPMHDSEDQKLKMAEANLKLLEHQEELQEQKLKMAEANLRLLELKEQIEYEKERSEKLLRNLLPAKVANDLKNTGTSVPESFDNVSVFFSDIVDFTQITSTIEPHEVIRELSDIFTEFDKIFNRNHCERIKTIGDAYLSVSGMPAPDANHWKNILNAALEAMDYLRSRNCGDRMKWHMRMGIHSGRVVGGIVGIEKYIYDVFGDTINTAARMEKHSQPMHINVSEETFNLAKDFFNFTERQPVEVKGKGMTKMYFLDSRKN
ncbi:MAG: adenylate/guanylate cyclase domain-containing protein [Victivallaceae bacterium]